jgi:nucleotide-binding universal stress UspA family protein
MEELRPEPTVVVGVDGSPDALRAVHWAAAEADRRLLPLRLVNVFAWVAETGFRGEVAAYRDKLLGRARAQLAAAAAVASEVRPGLAVQQQLAVGFPAELLAVEASRARLLVLGDRGLSRLEGVLVGSTAAALAVHAACPVVVVRGAELDEHAVRARPVVVGVDETTGSEAALGFAFEAAAARGVPLVAVHAYDLPVTASVLGKLIDWTVLAEDAQQRLAVHLAVWIEKYPEVPVEQVPALDRPVHQLLALSETAQLVVVGSRGRGQLTGLLLGSVSNALMHKAACPVAVARANTA